jgi:hypothetical protein
MNDQHHPPLGVAVDRDVGRFVGSAEHVALWDAINALVIASGGRNTVSTARMAKAVAGVERAVASLRAEVEALRATIEGAAHGLEKARVRNGTGWHYNPIHPLHYGPVLERLRAALMPNAKAHANPEAKP